MSLNSAWEQNWDNIIDQCLADLKAMHPRLNDSQIADKVGIPRSTYNRLKNEKKMPRLDNLLKIVLKSGNTQYLGDALSLIEDDLGDMLKDALEVSLKEENQILQNEELEALLQDSNSFVTYLLCDLDNGTDLDSILEVLGNPGEEALSALIKRDVIYPRNGRFYVTKRGTLVRSFDSIKNHLSTYANHYKPSHVGMNRNYVHSISDGLSIEGLAAVQAAHKRFHEEIQAIMRDERMRGDIPSFSVAFCDSFTKVNSMEGEK